MLTLSVLSFENVETFLVGYYYPFGHLPPCLLGIVEIFKSKKRRKNLIANVGTLKVKVNIDNMDNNNKIKKMGCLFYI